LSRLALRAGERAPGLGRGRRHGLGEKAGLVGEVLTVYARTQLWLRREGLEAAVARARLAKTGRSMPGEGREALFYAVRLGRVVDRVLTPLPTDSRCLAQSLTLIAMLARRGAGATLVVGVSPQPRFKAHAWVEREGHPLLPPGGRGFERLLEL